jgi:hypothetical protein
LFNFNIDTVDMKKLLLLSLSALLLPACADKNQYEQAVLEQMQKEQQMQADQGLKDYKIAPEELTKCIVDTSASNMPGIFFLDPNRMMAYRNYAKMLTYRNYAKELMLSKPANPKKALQTARAQLVTDFGSEQALNDALKNYSESAEGCYSGIISKSEADEKDK